MKLYAATAMFLGSAAVLGARVAEAGLGGGPTGPPKVSFGEALRAADANAATPEGKRHDSLLARYASEHHGPTMGACVEASKPPDLASFTVLLQLAADGKVTQALVKPETNVGVCFRDKMKTQTLPAPPRPDYWIRIDMQLAP